MDTIISTFDFSHPIWQGIWLALLFGLTLLVAWSPLRKIVAYRQLQMLINRLGADSLRHTAIIDDADMPVYLEYLILQPEGLLLLIVKPYRGNIFAAEKIENWTQVIRHHSFKFTNPLHELETNLQALRGMLPKVNIQGLIVFTQGAHFPKGKPEAVCNIDELKALTRKIKTGEIPVPLRESWERLRRNAQTDKNLHPAILYQKGDKRRLIFGIFLLFVCLIYLVQYMGWLKGIV